MTDDDYKLFCAARAVANLVFAKLDKHDGSTMPASGKSLWFQDRRSESANPYYGQTESGLILEMYYGLPSTLHTPWGKWGFAGSGSGWFNDLVADLLLDLGATIRKGAVINEMGEFGPWYSLAYVADVNWKTVLPSAITRKQSEYLAYEHCDCIWAEMTARYMNEAKQ